MGAERLPRSVAPDREGALVFIRYCNSGEAHSSHVYTVYWPINNGAGVEYYCPGFAAAYGPTH